MSSPPPTSAAHQHADAHKQRFVDTLLRHLDITMTDAPPGLPRIQYWDLLASKVDLNLPRDLGAAVAAGDIEDARGFLQQPGVDVDAYDADGATLTYIAAAHGHTAMVAMLVDEGGADVRKATPDDAKALLIEAWRLNPPSQEDQDESDGGACPLYI